MNTWSMIRIYSYERILFRFLWRSASAKISSEKANIREKILFAYLWFLREMPHNSLILKRSITQMLFRIVFSAAISPAIGYHRRVTKKLKFFEYSIGNVTLYGFCRIFTWIFTPKSTSNLITREWFLTLWASRLGHLERSFVSDERGRSLFYQLIYILL